MAPYFAIFTFAPQVFAALQLSDTRAGTIAANGIAAVGALVGMLTIERMGRRRQLIGPFWIMAVALLVVGVWPGRPLDRPAPQTMVNTFHVGGAVHAVGPEETAFAERSSPFMVSVDTMWTDPAQDASAIAWGRAAWEEMGKFGNGNVFLNFTGLADEPAQAGVDSAFGRNLRRLGQIKAAYDPDNLFQVNNNIVPAP